MFQKTSLQAICLLLSLIQYTNTSGRYDTFKDESPISDRDERADSYLSDSEQNRTVDSYIQTAIARLLITMLAPDYKLDNRTGDLLEFFTDKYPLPYGKKYPYREYDYVIIGAGSGGSTLASRLTEDPHVTVLLLEAGKPESLFTDIPSLAHHFQTTEYAWPYYLEPQPGVCMGMINQRCYSPTGKAVGGSSVINSMIYSRGRPQEWDRIAEAGNYGWSYPEVLEYFMKSEHADLEGLEHSPYRSRTGELSVDFLNYRTPLVKAFIEAASILGHPIMDYNDPEKLGFGYIQVTSKLGRRVSAARAFLHYNKKRSNLHILPMTRVTKILIDGETKTAYGAEFVRNHVKQQVMARREVILSAGPIASPQLLMLSGIGPRKHLHSLGISVIQDLPVGRTLFNHIDFPGLIYTLNVTGVSLLERRDATLENVLKWIQFGDGPMAIAVGVEGLGYIKTPNSDEPEGVPDIELLSRSGSIVSGAGSGGSKAGRRGMMISEEVFDGAFDSMDGTDTWNTNIMLTNPKSVGYLELKDNNPFSHPRIYGNYFTDPRDVIALIGGIRHVQALAETAPFQKFGARMHRAQYPTCHSLKFDSDAYWECAMRTMTNSLHHQIGTCRMGPEDDPQAIVDPQLRVYGIKRLRVVDSSVIPRPTAAHTYAPAIMIGEKAADMIKGTWSRYQP